MCIFKNTREGQKSILHHKGGFFVVLYFIVLAVGLIMVNFTAFNSYSKIGLKAVMPLDSILFLLVGLLLLGISCFAFLQLYKYKTGKLFAFYSLMIGISIALAPCSRINTELVTFCRAILTIASSVMLFEVIGYLTLLTKQKMYKLCRIILAGVAISGIFAHLLSLFSISSIWIYIIATESVNGSVILSALFSLIVMGIDYRKSNAYARKQSKILLWGIGMGVVLYFLASISPNVFMVQNVESDTQTYIELAVVPSDTVVMSIPLLLFSGVSIAIIFMMLRREFVVNDIRLKIKYFIMVPLYLGIFNTIIFAYANCSLWLLVIINFLLLIPFIKWCCTILCQTVNEEEYSYQWSIMKAIETEKQELAAYLHDDVLQSLIAFYRQVQADESKRYEDMKPALSKLISQIRSVSHNLYPTIVEDLGLEQSLNIFINGLKEDYPEVNVDCEYKLMEGILPKVYALTFYRIIRELVTNAAKHSGGLQVKCILSEDDNEYYICVQDNGKGYSAFKNDDLIKSPHMGLYTVKRQVSGLQGHMNCESGAQSGTSYNIYFPKKEE